MRTIDADALIAKINERLYDESNPFPAEITEALDMIENAPTVDITFREVVAYECGQKSVEEKLAKIEQICKEAFSDPETQDINLYRAQALANIYHLFIYDEK